MRARSHTAYNNELNWHKAHNILMPAFTKTAMQNYHDSMAATVRELIEAWKIHSANQSWIDVPDQANRLTVEIIARVQLRDETQQIIGRSCRR